MAQSAPAIGIFKNGDMLILHSDFVTGDENKIEEALTPDVKYVVIRGVRNGDSVSTMTAARHIESANVTTVVQGYCAFTCTRLFLAGKRRMFSGEGRLEATYLGLGGRYYTDGGVVIDDYAYVTSQTDIPGKFLREYIQQRDNSLKIFHPKAVLMKGSTVFGCGKKTNVSDCDALPSLTAINTRVITTEELYKSSNLVVKADDQPPPKSNFAKLTETPPIQTLSDKCRNEDYREFLKQDSPRAFVISSSNACYWRNAQTFTPLKFAMEACQKAVGDTGTCKFYAVNDDVVFTPF